jgi:hypothetical protein
MTGLGKVSSGLLEGIVRFREGIDRFMGRYRQVSWKGIVRFVEGIVRFVEGIVRFVEGIVRFGKVSSGLRKVSSGFMERYRQVLWEGIVRFMGRYRQICGRYRQVWEGIVRFSNDISVLGLERELEQYFMHFYFYNIYSPNIFLRQK